MEEATPSSPAPATPPPSKTGLGLYITGFVISLIALLFWFYVSKMSIVIAAFGGGYLVAAGWLALSVVGLIFGIAGLLMARKAKGKTGLAASAVTLGITATILSGITLYQAYMTQKATEDLKKEIMKMFSTGASSVSPADSSGH